MTHNTNSESFTPSENSESEAILSSVASNENGSIRKNIASLLIPITISLAILYFLYRNVSISSILGALKEINLFWTITYLILSSLEPVMRGLRWNNLICADNRFGSVKALYIAKATNNLLPLRAGDAIRAQFARDRFGTPYSRSVASIIAELVIDIFLLSILGFFFATLSPDVPQSIIIICSLGASFIFIMALFLKKWAANDNLSPPGRVSGFIFRTFRYVVSITSGYKGRAALRWSFAIWIHAIITTYCGLRMCLPFVSLEGTLANIVFVYFSVIIPSAPGFVGTYHAAVTGSMLIMGFTLNDFPLAPLLIHLLQFVPQTIIGLSVGLNYIAKNDWRASLSHFRKVRSSFEEESN